MKHFIKAFFITSVSILCAFQTLAQTEEVIVKGTFSNVPFKQFVPDVEGKTGYKFYYNPTQADTLIVNAPGTERTLTELLYEVFKGTDFHFVVDVHKNIFVTRTRVVQAELPGDFFDRGDKANDEQYSKAISDYLDSEKLKKAKATAEDKLYNIGIVTATFGQGEATIAGHVRSMESGEPLVGVAISSENGIGIATDQFGYYALTLSKGAHQLRIKSIGYKGSVRRILLYSNGQLDIELQEEVTALKEITIESDRDKNVAGMQMGLERLDIKTMKKIPVALGEVDILKVVLTLPGVQSVGEASNGLNVRGGATNQNLILFNDATIYNPTHLFGFFSAFNPDAVKNVELYKSGIPAEYGGRLSSVLDVTTREGNKKKFAGTGGIGFLTGRLTLEGPIIKDKTSFLIGARTTYSDWLLKKIPNETYKNSKAQFTDINANINHEINSKNTIYLSGYYSYDQFKLKSDTVYSYRNKSATAKWKHIFDNKLYGVLTGSYSGYDYNIYSEKNPVNAFTLKYAVDQVQWKADFSYFPVPKHGLNFGASTIHYSLTPGAKTPRGINSLVEPDILAKEQALESGVYLSDHYEITPRLSAYAGFRYSFFNYLGPRELYTYANGVAKTEANITDTVSFKAGKSIVNYQGPEYRFSLNYLISGNASVKLSFNRMRQYLQMLSNTTAVSPTDIWKLSDPNIKPQIGDQVALGFYKNLRSNTIETSIEGYYKTTQNSIDYKSGAKLILNHHIETDIVHASGKAYGVEFMIKKLTGKVNGWVSYTYSRSFLRTNSPYASESVNNGDYYRSNYDKPHAINLIGNYKFSHRFSTSLNFTYSTGRPITLPIAKYQIDGVDRLVYGPRNGDRIPDYIRLDFGLNIEGNHRIKKLAHSSWTIGVYNMLARKNAYSVYFESRNGTIQGYKLSIFGTAIPTVTYNFRF